jgi:hypothetical protein
LLSRTKKSHTPPVFPASIAVLQRSFGLRSSSTFDTESELDSSQLRTPTIRELPIALGYQPQTFETPSITFWVTICISRLLVASAFCEFLATWSRLRTSLWVTELMQISIPFVTARPFSLDHVQTRTFYLPRRSPSTHLQPYFHLAMKPSFGGAPSVHG